MEDLGRWLLEEKLISPGQLKQALDKKESSNVSLQMALMDLDILSERALVDLVARRHDVPCAPDRLYRTNVSIKALSAIPQDLCWQHSVFPFGIDQGAQRLQLAVVDPGKIPPLEILGKLATYQIELFVIGPRQLEKAIRKHFLDSMVEDTGARKPRFFGYENITNPNLSLTLSDLDAQGQDVRGHQNEVMDEVTAVDEAPAPRQAKAREEARPVKPIRKSPTPVEVPKPEALDNLEDSRPIQVRDRSTTPIGTIPTRNPGYPNLSAARDPAGRIATLERAVIEILSLLTHDAMPEPVRAQALEIGKNLFK